MPVFSTLLFVGTTFDEPLYYVNSMRILVRTGLHFYLNFYTLIKSLLVDGAPTRP